jgi:hypothetical protein
MISYDLPGQIALVLFFVLIFWFIRKKMIKEIEAEKNKNV